MNRSRKILVGLVFLLGFICISQIVFAKTPLPTDLRFRYGGSSVITLPTGYCRSSVAYINDNKESFGFISQSLGELLEVSILRYWSGEYKNENSVSGKIALMTEGDFLPAIAVGAVDVNTVIGDDRIYYAAVSKNFDIFGITFHAGIYKDPVDKDKIVYYGVEKILFPLISISAERVEDKNTYGIKLSPYPGLSLDIAQRDGKEELFNLVYSRSY